jgi:DNA-binding transcriptional LysR family regulator
MQGASLDDIRVFVAVVDTGSFVAGGSAVGLSRSAAGKSVARLENRLGRRLLNRSTRALSPTDEGHVFCEHARGVLAAVEEAEASVAGPRGTPRGVLRLTVPDAFGRIVVLPLLRQDLHAWPDVQLELSFSDRVADMVEEGFDLAIRIGMTSPDTRLVSRTLATYPAVLCAAPAYLAARDQPRDLESLLQHECLVFSSRNQRQHWRFHSGDGIWVKATGRSRLRLDSAEAIRDAAIDGLGIALLPDFLVAQELAAGRLQRVLSDWETDEVRVLAVYPQRRLLEPRVRRFIDLMVTALATGPVPRSG